MARIDNLNGGEHARLKKRMSASENASPLANSSVERGQLRMYGGSNLLIQDGNFQVTGGSSISGVQTVSGTQTVTGASTVSGTQTISGTQTVSGTQQVNGTQNQTGPFNLTGTQTVSGGGKIVVGTLTISPDGPFGASLTATELDFDSTYVRITGELRMFGGAMFFGLPTTTSSANLRMSALGQLQEVTSAARFKIDPQPMVLPDALLDVPVESWVDRGDAERYAATLDAPRPLTRKQQIESDGASFERVPGVIAEKVEAAGGGAFVGYNEDGVIQSVAYDRLALARTQILADRLDKALQRIDELEKLIA